MSEQNPVTVHRVNRSGYGVRHEGSTSGSDGRMDRWKRRIREKGWHHVEIRPWSVTDRRRFFVPKIKDKKAQPPKSSQGANQVKQLRSKLAKAAG